MSEVTRIATTLKGKVPDKAIPWIIGQSAHETGTSKGPWTSNVYIKNNNGFGMIQPRVRKTTSLGPGTTQPGSEGSNPYARYTNLEDSTKDLVLWLNYNKVPWLNINSADQYIAWIKKKGYFGATYENYLKGVLSWIKKLKLPSIFPVFTGGTILLIGIIALVLLKK